MAVIEVKGKEFNVKMTQQYFKDIAKKAEEFEKVMNNFNKTVEIDTENLNETLHKAGEACLSLLFPAFGRKNVVKAIGDEIEIAELVEFTTEACIKLAEKAPKEDEFKVKIKL